MDTKDILSISISLLAFILSLTATIISVVRSNREKQRAVKGEMGEILDKLIENQIEQATYYRDYGATDLAYFQQVSSILSQQNAHLLYQATYLADQVPELVTAVEYNTIALAAANAGDLLKSEGYHHKAIAASPDGYYKSLAMRSYAGFLFPQRRFEEARRLFGEAISMLAGGGNQERYTNGFTYQMWAWHELHNAASPKRAEALFESAANEFRGIDNEMTRNQALLGVEAAKRAPAPPETEHKPPTLLREA